jgi:hypothetical protein
MTVTIFDVVVVNGVDIFSIKSQVTLDYLRKMELNWMKKSQISNGTKSWYQKTKVATSIL